MAEFRSRVSHPKASIWVRGNFGRPESRPGVGRESRRIGFCLMAELYTWPDILTTLLERRDLSVSESTWAMRQVMAGSATPSQLGGFLVALRAKGETVDEIVGFRDAILEA